MPYRYHGRAIVDPSNPAAFGICDRCNFTYQHRDLQFQYQYNGSGLYNTRFLVCQTCLDAPQAQLLNPILPPDPMPVLNPRPFNYAAAETGYNEPLAAQIYTSEVAIGNFYLDLFDGDPEGTGESVLEDITGSATRTNYAASMGAPSGDVALNTAAITPTTQSQNSVNVTHVAIYSAATAGTLLMSAALINPVTVVLYNGVTFGVGDLQVTLNQ